MSYNETEEGSCTDKKCSFHNGKTNPADKIKAFDDMIETIMEH